MSEEKLSLFEIMGIIDIGGSQMWNEFSDAQKKAIPFYVLNRWLSARLSNKREDVELGVLMTNEYYNKHFFELAKHPELQWMIASMVGGRGRKIRREWIGLKRKSAKSALMEFISSVYPTMSDAEIKMFIEINSVSDLKQLAMDNGFDDAEIKKMFS